MITGNERVGTMCDKCRQPFCICEFELKEEIKELKPIRAKPQFYAICLSGLQAVAKLKGYNLIIHGSMNRDMDLVAIPWVDDCSSHLELLSEFCEYLGISKSYRPTNEAEYMFSTLGGGRSSYVINLNRGNKFNNYLDAQYYLDISITPLAQERGKNFT